MYLDVTELRDFYARPLGGVAARSVGQALAGLVQPGASARVMGFGFATPYLAPLRGSVERLFAFMPAGQGVIDWPQDGCSMTALVEEDALPLPDASIDWVILVHALELSPRPRDLMVEIARVLAEGGRLAAVVPNRQGPWARSEASPFGYGRPFSRGQVKSLFAEASFEVEAWATALHMPPIDRRSVLRLAGTLDKTGATLWPAFSGVTCVQACKRRTPLIPARKRRAFASRLKPALNPSGVTGGLSA